MRPTTAADARPPEAGAGASTAVPFGVKVLVAAAVVAGVVFRFVTRSGLWLDEALSVNIASLAPSEMLEALRHDGHPPLYYFLLHHWMELFGSGDLATRSMSALFGLASLPLAWVIGKRRGGALLAWVFLGALAMSPFALRYGSEARMYSLVPFLVMVGYLLVDDVVRRARPTTGRLVGLAVVAGLLLLSHYWAIWLLGAVGIVLLWHWRRSDDAELRTGAIRAVAAIIGGGVLFLWWLPSMLYQSAHTGTPWSQPLRPSVTASLVFIDFAASTGFPDAPFIAVLTSVIFAVGVFGVSSGRFEVRLDLRTNPQVRFESLVIALTMVIGIAVGFATRTAFASRYAAVVFPLFVLVVAAGITRFSERRILVSVLAALLATWALAAVYNAFVFQRTQAVELAEEIRALGEPGDTVVFCPDQLGPSGARALGPGYVTMSFPTLGAPELVDWVDYPARNAAVDAAAVGRDVVARTPPDRSIFVVWGGTYRTMEGKCEAMIGEISAARSVSRTLAGTRPEKYYEGATLSWFGPVPVAATGGPP